MSPTAPTCGSVKITRGERPPSERSSTSRPRIVSATSRPWYLPMCVSRTRPLTSPTAYSQSWPGTRRSSPTSSGLSAARPSVSRPMPPVPGLRPTATSSSSASTIAAVVELEREGSRARDARRRRPRRTSTPELAQRLEHLLARERLLALDQARAAMDQRHGASRARPTPAPSRRRRRRRRGSRGGAAPRFAVVASLFVHGLAARRPGMSGIAAVEPVATTTALRATSDSCPSTSTSSFPAIRARPRTSVTPRCSSHGSCALSSRSWMTSSRRRSTAALSIGDGLEARHAPHLVRELDRAQQRLRRHARVERAVAADERLLDDRHREAVLAQAARRHLAGRAGADHHNVEFAHATPVPRTSGWCARPQAVATRWYSWPISGLESTKSAVARLHAIGTL